MKSYLTTDNFIVLIHKAYELASICEYDTSFDTRNGILQFYNSPLFRSFTLIVNPFDFRDDPAAVLMMAFERRGK